MFAVAGRFNGKDYDSKFESIPLSEVEEVLTSDMKKVMKSRGNLEIHLNKETLTMSGAIGSDLVGINSEQPIFTATNKDGSQFTLRWFTGSTVTDKGATRYSPKRLPPMAKANVFPKDKQRELCVFLLLSPRCEQSPFAKADGCVYMVLDHEAASRKQLEAIELEENARALISGSDAQILRMKAHGIKVESPQGLLQVYDIDNTDDQSVKLRLIQMAKANPGSFIEQWNSAGTDAMGIIMQAVNSGMIVPELTPLRNTRWKWRHDVNDGVEIVTVDKSQDPRAGLVNRILSDGIEAYAKIFAQYGNSNLLLEASSDEVNSAVKIMSSKKKVSDMTVDELIEVAIQKDKIVFDAIGSAVRFTDADLNVLDWSFPIVNKKEWKQEFSKLGKTLEAELRDHVKKVS